MGFYGLNAMFWVQVKYRMSFKMQGFRFAGVGAVTAVIYYAVLYILVEYINISIVISSSLAYILAISFNYVMHYQWTFSSDIPHKVALLRFVIMNVGGFIINLLIMAYGSSRAPQYYLVIQALAICVIVIWNFTISSLWVFNSTQQRKSVH